MYDSFGNLVCYQYTAAAVAYRFEFEIEVDIYPLLCDTRQVYGSTQQHAQQSKHADCTQGRAAADRQTRRPNKRTYESVREREGRRALMEVVARPALTLPTEPNFYLTTKRTGDYALHK